LRHDLTTTVFRYETKLALIGTVGLRTTFAMCQCGMLRWLIGSADALVGIAIPRFSRHYAGLDEEVRPGY
jgi:hypothetical protein